MQLEIGLQTLRGYLRTGQAKGMGRIIAKMTFGIEPATATLAGTDENHAPAMRLRHDSG